MAALSEVVLLASGARTTTQTLDPLALGLTGLTSPMGAPVLLEITLDLTAFVTAASLTLTFDIYDSGKNGWVTTLPGGVIAATGTFLYRVGLYAPNVANGSINSIIPNRWRVVVNHGNGNSHTYSVSARLLSV